jgi:ectoine hydroxylase-related dioxygenase (phytanoyl-CoA dioxygenase family)
VKRITSHTIAGATGERESRIPSDARAQFRRQGYVVVDKLVAPAEFARHGRAVDAAVAARRRDRPVAANSAPSEYQRQFDQFINLWEDQPAVRRLTFHPALASAAAQLLGVRAVRVFFDQALYKAPGGIGTPKHQDQTRWPIRELSTLTAWIPFDGATERSGTIGYIPASHTVGSSSYVDVVLGRGWSAASLRKINRPPVFIEVPPGAVCFHHCCTFHLTKPNDSDRERRVFTIVFFADGAHRGSAWPHPSVDRMGLAIGDRIEGSATPIAWPRRSRVRATPPALIEPPHGWPGHRPPVR